MRTAAALTSHNTPECIQAPSGNENAPLPRIYVTKLPLNTEIMPVRGRRGIKLSQSCREPRDNNCMQMRMPRDRDVFISRNDKNIFQTIFPLVALKGIDKWHCDNWPQDLHVRTMPSPGSYITQGSTPFLNKINTITSTL